MWLCQRRLLDAKGEPMGVGKKRTAAIDTLEISGDNELVRWFSVYHDESAWCYAENLDVKGPWSGRR